jgi:ABC-2 type transport system ATP-binding protein
VVEEPVVEDAAEETPAVALVAVPAETEPEVVEDAPEEVAEPDAAPEPEPEPDAEHARETEPDAGAEPDDEPAPEFHEVLDIPERAIARVLAPLGEPADGLALAVRGLTKRYGDTVAVDGIDLDVPSGCFYGFVGPNGAGKTTTLSMVTGLLRPDAGTAVVNGADIWADPRAAKRSLGVLPDRLRLFDRLTGAEYLQHAGALHGLDRATTARRAVDLIQAFGLESASRRFVSDFSAGMTKKLAIAAAMIHSPRLLVLDEPFESVDPVSAQLVIDVLKKFAAAGGTVLLSSHSMDLVQRVCDYVAIIADGHLLAAGPMAEVLDGASLEDRFVELAGGATAVEGMEWLQSFSD